LADARKLQADVLFYDMFLAFAKIIGRVLRTPSICSCPTFLLSKSMADRILAFNGVTEMDAFNKQCAKELERAYGVCFELQDCWGYYYDQNAVVYSIPELEDESWDEQKKPANVCYVGLLLERSLNIFRLTFLVFMKMVFYYYMYFYFANRMNNS